MAKKWERSIHLRVISVLVTEIHAANGVVKLWWCGLMRSGMDPCDEHRGDAVMVSHAVRLGRADLAIYSVDLCLRYRNEAFSIRYRVNDEYQCNNCHFCS